MAYFPIKCWVRYYSPLETEVIIIHWMPLCLIFKRHCLNRAQKIVKRVMIYISRGIGFFIFKLVSTLKKTTISLNFFISKCQKKDVIIIIIFNHKKNTYIILRFVSYNIVSKILPKQRYLFGSETRKTILKFTKNYLYQNQCGRSPD